MSKCRLYRKMVQHGIKLSRNDPSETNNKFKKKQKKKKKQASGMEWAIYTRITKRVSMMALALSVSSSGAQAKTFRSLITFCQFPSDFLSVKA